MPVVKSKEDTWSSKELENLLKTHNSTSNIDSKKMKTLKNNEITKSADSDIKKSIKREVTDKKDSKEKHKSSSDSKTNKLTESRHKDAKSIYGEKNSKSIKEKPQKSSGDSDKKHKSSKVSNDEKIKTKSSKRDSSETPKSHYKKNEESDYEDDFEVYDDDDFENESDDDHHSKISSKSIKKKEEPELNKNKKSKSRHKSPEDDEDSKIINKKSTEPEIIKTKRIKSRNKSPEVDEDSKIINKKSSEDIQNIKELQKAIEFEKEKLLSQKKHSNLDNEDNTNKKLKDLPDDNVPLQHVESSVIDFQKKKSKDAKKSVEPEKRLADVIEETTKAASQYELIFTNYFNSNRSLAFSQTGDDDNDITIQTDDIVMHNKWTQHPMHVFLQASGDDSTKNIMDLDINFDASAFNKFILKAGKVMLSVLEDNASENLFKNLQNVQSNLAVSEAFIELKAIDLLKDRAIKYACNSDLSNHKFLSIHAPYSHMESEKQNNFKNKAIISLWNIFESDLPQRLLMGEAQANCCCFHPFNLSIVFAGLIDGSISIWDTRLRAYGSKSDIPYQFQSYTTACQNNENHCSEVISIVPIVSQKSGSLKENNVQTEISAFQLASLEADSIIYLWVMSENMNKDEAGSQSELGLAPGAHVKLIRSQCINLVSPIRSLSGKFTSFELSIPPSNNDHMFISTSLDGAILLEQRFQKHVVPRVFKSRTLANVAALDFSPFMDSIFMAGYEDGCLSIFHIEKDVNLTFWENSTNGSSIVSVRWCKSRPSVFFVLDSLSNFYIWDLSVDSSAPLKSQRTFNKKASTFFLSGDKDFKLDSQTQNMIIFYEDGSSELHKIKPELSALLSNEINFFEQFINSFF